MGEFVHLHLHTEYSLLDGASRINQGHSSPLVDALKAKGMKAVAITDHGNMYGVYAFVKALTGTGIKPIIGSEFYFVENIKNRDPLEKRKHLILLAKNNEGYKNLMKLSSISFKDGFYYRPRIDIDLLKQYSKGLICMTACIQGAVPNLILQDNYEGAKRHALKLKSIFDDGDFYIEVQNHGLEKELYANPQLLKLAKEIGVKVVATNDVHYLEKTDADMQDVLMCISMKKQLNDPDRIKLAPQEFYLKDYDEMREKFEWCPEALDNTLEIADKCNVTIKIKADPGEYEIPVYEITDPKYKDVPNVKGQRESAFLRDLAYDGLNKRYDELTEQILERFEMELKVIISMGFAGYYLIVWDFINYAKTHKIPVGPGRGSGVGSIIAYAIGITNVEPLKYNLIFERFLNPERVSMPDFDIDFCTQRRAEVINYVADRYGEERVAQIITYGTLSARAVIKDVSRVYSISYADADKWAKAIPSIPKITISAALGRANYDSAEDKAKQVSPDLIKYYEEDIVAKSIIDMALRLENLPRQTGMHAAGVLICPAPVDSFVPLQRSGEFITTQFDKKQVEAMGLLKMDFLGLNTLTDINLTLDYIEQTTGKRPDLDAMDCDDPEIYKLISSGDTKAIFQIENEGMRKFMVQLQPNCLEEIIAGVALYRPGPMQFIPDYIRGKNNPDSVKYLHPMLKNILDVTYGCIVYQEQVMQIAREIAGYSFGGADELRRAMGKKDTEVMKANKTVFIYGKEKDGKVEIEGAVRRGIPEKIADKLFDQILDFAKYAFNKSHATAYSVITYQTAYLKRYYPLHFMAAVLNNRITNSDEVSNYINYLNSINVKVLPPDINKSKVKFSIENKDLRFGLMAIKNVGETAVEAIIKERNEDGDFTDLENFVSRVSGNINKRMIESMIKGGVFDLFGRNRSILMASYEQIMENDSQDKKHRDCGQMSLFDTLVDDDFIKFKYPEIDEYSEINKLIFEKEVLGMYVTGHPLNSYRDELKKLNFNTGMLIVENNENEDDIEAEVEIGQNKNTVNYDNSLNGKWVQIGGVVNQFDKKFTKRGDSMGIGVIEDLYGQIEFILYSNTFEKYRDLLSVNAFIILEGTLNIKEDERPKISVKNVKELNIEKAVEPTKITTQKLVITLHGKQEKIMTAYVEIRNLLNKHIGDNVVLFDLDMGKMKPPEGVEISNELINDISAIIGRQNVQFID